MHPYLIIISIYVYKLNSERFRTVAEGRGCGMWHKPLPTHIELQSTKSSPSRQTNQAIDAGFYFILGVNFSRLSPLVRRFFRIYHAYVSPLKISHLHPSSSDFKCINFFHCWSQSANKLLPPPPPPHPPKNPTQYTFLIALGSTYIIVS